MTQHVTHSRRSEQKCEHIDHIWRNAGLVEMRVSNECNWEPVTDFTRERAVWFKILSRKSDVPKGNQQSCWEDEWGIRNDTRLEQPRQNARRKATSWVAPEHRIQYSDNFEWKEGIIHRMHRLWAGIRHLHTDLSAMVCSHLEAIIHPRSKYQAYQKSIL
jgi:hypothetical protein